MRQQKRGSNEWNYTKSRTGIDVLLRMLTRETKTTEVQCYSQKTQVAKIGAEKEARLELMHSHQGDRLAGEEREAYLHHKRDRLWRDRLQHSQLKQRHQDCYCLTSGQVVNKFRSFMPTWPHLVLQIVPPGLSDLVVSPSHCSACAINRPVEIPLHTSTAPSSSSQSPKNRAQTAFFFMAWTWFVSNIWWADCYLLTIIICSGKNAVVQWLTDPSWQNDK